MIDGAAVKPYKGPESYQAEDAALFFGRDAEADHLIAKIVSSRFTLLHAQSGAGKTSLVNARVVPGLQSKDWLAVRVLPQNDPVESIRVTVLQTLFPPLSVERDAISAASQALRNSNDDPPVESLLAHYDELDVRDPVRLQLVQKRPAANQISSAIFPSSGEYDPVFCRLLRGEVDISQYGEHLRALGSLHSSGEALSVKVDARMPVSELLGQVQSVESEVPYEDIISQFYAPVPDLFAFCANIADSYGRWRPKFRIVLIFDQFEELFTRFIDTGAVDPDLPVKPLDWRLRWELFEQLKRLYVGDGKEPLPIRFVVSIRDEYIAKLDPLRAFVPDLDAGAYHLDLLDTAAAREAIGKPATMFGYRYSPECFDLIVRQLTKEGRYIEPTHLQIVCEKLWFRKGRELAGSAAARNSDVQHAPEIEASDLTVLNGAAGILRSFFREFVDELTPEDRRETLEMLEMLVTASGSRNIVELADLTHPKYRRTPRREDLLRRLERRTIVRVENRLGGQFAEITHEFLIGPILDTMREDLLANPDGRELRILPRLLGMYDGIDFRAWAGRLLNEHEFRLLHRFRDSLRWEPWSAELMLRSAIMQGITGPDLEYWIALYESFPLAPENLLEDEAVAARLLSAEEITTVRKMEGPLSEALSTSLLRTVLLSSRDDDREEIMYWIRRLLQDDRE